MVVVGGQGAGRPDELRCAPGTAHIPLRCAQGNTCTTNEHADTVGCVKVCRSDAKAPSFQSCGCIG